MKLDTFEDVQAAFSAVEELRKKGRLAGALDGYIEIIEARMENLVGGGDATELSAADLTILERTAELAALFGHHEAADDLLAAMADQLEQVENYVGSDYTTLKRTHLALGCGRLRDADSLLRAMRPRIGELDDIIFSASGLARWEAERKWPGANDDDRAVLLSRLYHVMGWLLADLGQYESALRALERGLMHAGDEAHPLARRVSLPLRLAVVGALLEKGEMREARVRLAAIRLDIDENANPGFYVRCLELQGKYSMLCGDYGDAHANFKRAWTICASRRFMRPALTAALNLAHVLILLNHTGVAKQLLLATATSGSELGEASAVSRAHFLIRLADARSHPLSGNNESADHATRERHQDGKISAGQEFLTPSDPLDLSQSDNYLAFFEDRSLGFHWYLALGDTELAAQLHSEMRQTFGATDSALIQLRLRVMEAVVAYYRGELMAAERGLNECRQQLKGLGLTPELWQAQRVLGWCWTRLGCPDAQRRELDRENSELLSRMTESLPADYRAVFLLNKWTADEEYIAGEIDHLCALKDELAAGPLVTRPWRRWGMMKRLLALVKHIDRYKDALAKREQSGAESEERAGEDESLWSRLWRHPRKRATFSFLVLPDRLLIVRTGWLVFDFEVRRVSRLEVRELARDWHTVVNRPRSGRGGPGGDTTINNTGLDYVASLIGPHRDFSPPGEDTGGAGRVTEILRRMSDTLGIGRLLSALPRRIESLVIVPDDSLHGFPFAALIHEGEFLVQRYAISLAFEANVRRLGAGEVREGAALLVGVAWGNVALGGKVFPPLPQVRSEVKHLKEWLSARGLPVTTLEDGEATKLAILNHLQSATLLHMACHGIFEPDEPDASGMVLIPSSEQTEILSLRELSKLNLAGLRHVSLSCCWSADNFILPGRWIIGLPETLWRAGAQSVLGHLWRMDDSLAVSFVKSFYEKAVGHNMDEALRHTQLSCLRKNLPGSGDIDVSNPIHWAGYNLYGDYRRLRL